LLRDTDLNVTQVDLALVMPTSAHSCAHSADGWNARGAPGASISPARLTQRHGEMKGQPARSSERRGNAFRSFRPRCERVASLRTVACVCIWSLRRGFAARSTECLIGVKDYRPACPEMSIGGPDFSRTINLTDRHCRWRGNPGGALQS
jgi:hypothetical protein